MEFYGEEGVDEGGLQKEFFQLIIEKLFDPMYGELVVEKEKKNKWDDFFTPFSPTRAVSL